MKKFLLFLSPILAAILVFFVAIYILAQRSGGKGALQVTSQPQALVYLNGKMIGKTPLCKCQQQDLLTTGNYTVRIVPTDNSLDPYEENVSINTGVLTVIDRTFGDVGKSNGSVITLTPLADSSSPAQLFISTSPYSANISVDGNDSGQAPTLLSNMTESDHEVTVSKVGYHDKTIRIHTVKGYKLSATVYLATDLTIQSNNASSSATPIATVSATPTPSTAQVTILDTPTGFLRVRDTPSLGGNEIAQVHPGETYPFVDAQAGWIEIQLPTGKSGWVSDSYAKKQ